jgi:hypothetical protein
VMICYTYSYSTHEPSDVRLQMEQEHDHRSVRRERSGVPCDQVIVVFDELLQIHLTVGSSASRVLSTKTECGGAFVVVNIPLRSQPVPPCPWAPERNRRLIVRAIAEKRSVVAASWRQPFRRWPRFRHFGSVPQVTHRLMKVEHAVAFWIDISSRATVRTRC